MAIIVVVALLLGAAFGVRSNVFQLMAATLSVSTVCFLIGRASGGEAWPLATTIVAVVVSLQTGYVGALAVGAAKASHDGPRPGPAAAAGVETRWKRYTSSGA